MYTYLPFSYVLYGLVAVSLCVLGLLMLIGKVPLQYNFRNLAVRWRITLLTALAFTLVIGLLTVLLAFVNGMYKLTEGTGHPGNVIVLSDGATDELFSNLNSIEISDIDRQEGVLPFDDKRMMASREVYIIGNQPVPVKPGEREKRRFIQIRGIEDPEVSAKIHDLKLHPGGQWFSEAGVREVPNPDGGTPIDAIEAVLGEGVAKEIGKDQNKPRLEVGDLFELGPRKWVVVGITQSAGSTFGSEVWAKRGNVGEMYGKDRLTTVVVRTANADAAQKLAEFLRTDYKKAALRAEPETVYYSKLQETNRTFLIGISFVAVVMAVGGIFGVMNTMFAAISQRSKDIGVLRMLGFSRWQVLVSFLLESLLIALVGGGLGLLIGYLFNGQTATSIVSGGQGGGKSVVLKLVVDGTILAVGLLFTLLMGLMGGLLPSLSAMRLRPLESLR